MSAVSTRCGHTSVTWNGAVLVAGSTSIAASTIVSIPAPETSGGVAVRVVGADDADPDGGPVGKGHWSLPSFSTRRNTSSVSDSVNGDADAS